VQKFRKKPGFFLSLGFLSLREGPETGFLSKSRMVSEKLGKNPVSS